MEHTRGCKCCCWQLCTCVDCRFFMTPTGGLKFSQIVACAISQYALIKYSLKIGPDLGQVYIWFLSLNSAYLFISIMLYCTYSLSFKTLIKVRSSLMDSVFSTVGCILYALGSSYLIYRVHVDLYYFFVTIPHFQTYPALIVTCAFGYVLSLLYGIDAIMAYCFSCHQPELSSSA